tara:strand:- start:1243 stop:2268 length:1026 start_codon:yes stop_codon:yes gene_type:complete
MAVTNQWELFGLDLSRGIDKLKLGVSQLLWSEEAGLRQKFYPEASLLNPGKEVHDRCAKLVPASELSLPQQPKALILPSDLMLAKQIEMPIEAELDLDAAMRFELASNSPFASEETCAGWRVVVRDDTSLRVTYVIAARTAVHDLIARYAIDSADSVQQFEIWAETDGHLVQVETAGDIPRNALYLQRLRQQGKKLGLLALAVCLLVMLPGAILAARSSQLAEVLALTEAEASAATAARNELVIVENRVLSAREFFAGRSLYDEWLHTLSDVTPDSVYLTRLGLEGNRLTISGMAMNAAEYQTKLASSGLVSDLSAPSAFTRDQRTGRERFTLTMSLDSAQ